MTPEQEVRTHYRNTFLTQSGRKVLAHMLAELGFFSTAATDEEIATQNYARVLLGNLGIISPDNVTRITEALLNMPTGGTTEDEGE